MPRFNAVPADISNLYTGGNQIFDTRQLGQMLYNEQKMREQKALQEDAQVAKMLQDDVGKVRSADVGLVTDMYGRVKGAKMNLMNPKVKQNPQLYALAQQAHQRAMNDYYTTVRGSQEEKEKDKLLTTFKPDERNDDYGSLMATRMKTPLNQLQNVQYNGRQLDLSNADSFRYMGSNTDFGKIMRDVAGTPRQVYAETKPLDKLGLQSEITPYYYGNSPAQVYSGLLGAFSQRGAGRDAALQWDALPKEQYEAVREAYKNIPADRLKKMGLDKPQELAEYNPDNKAENFARFKAMEYAINNEPEQRTPTYKTNELVKSNLDKANRREMALFEHGLRESEIKLRDELKGKTDESGGTEQYIQGLIDNASPLKVKINGKDRVLGYTINATQADMAPFAIVDNTYDKPQTIYPDHLELSPDKQKITPVFIDEPSGDKKDATINTIRSKPFSISQWSTPVAKFLAGTTVNKSKFGGSSSAEATQSKTLKLTKGALD